MELLALTLVALGLVVTGVESKPQRPIMLEISGGFNIGGRVIQSPFNPNMTLSCDHGYMEYFIPWRPRKTSIVMWHSSSTQTWQNRWDGGEGYKDMFLRRNYPVYLWDAPRLGRANWACEPTRYAPDYRDQGNFVAWNFGPRWPQWWDDLQFPKDADAEAWHQATSSRYVEYDTNENVELQSQTAAIAADSGKIGTDIVFLTNSASSMRAMIAATKANETNIKGIVIYEMIGLGVFPDNLNITTAPGGFGPFVVPLGSFKKLAKLPVVQFIWGDHRPEDNTYVRRSRLVSTLINQYGGNSQVLKLGEAGLKGNTHIAFADLNNVEIAGLLDELLESHGLDAYEDEEE